MPRPREERLPAVDGEGRPTFIVRVTPVIEDRTLEGTSLRDGVPTIYALDGEVLNRRDEGFIALHTRRRFRLVDPDA